MRIRLLSLSALVLCAGLLPGAQVAAVEYRIWAGLPSDVVGGRRAASYAFDSSWREISTSSDEWILARNSPKHIRLRSAPRRWWYSLDGEFRRSECDAGPIRWVIAPSGSVYACVNEYYPNTTLHVFRTSDRRPIATIKLVDGYIEIRNAIAMLDDDRVVFAKIDESCPRERLSRLKLSIAEISIQGPRSSAIVRHCASGVVVGTHRVAYLREMATEYSLDGASWAAGSMYGFDKDDNPITAESLPIRSFKARHAGLGVWLVSVGLAPAAEQR